MKYNRFEDLPVWKAALNLAVGIYQLTRPRWFFDKADVRDHMQRAALSVSNNIAEGLERGTTADLLTFLYIARGSAGEVRNCCHFCTALLDRGVPCDVPDLKSQIAPVADAAESVSRQIRAWAQSLQDGDIRGQRYLTQEIRQHDQRTHRAREFDERIRWTVRENMRRAGQPVEAGTGDAET